MRERQADDLSDELYPWDGVILFRTPRHLREQLARRTRGGYVQPLEAGYGDLFTDYYPVRIRRLPRLEGSRTTAEALLTHIRTNLNDFVDTTYSRFRPYGFNDAERRRNRLLWHGRSPLGALVHIDIDLGGVNLEDATVIVSRATPSSWMFSTVYTPSYWQNGNGAHPINGNREFAISESGDGSFTAWTRAADRVNGLLEWTANSIGLVFKGQDALWRSFQRKLADFVNDHDGEATIKDPLKGRFDWNEVRAWMDTFCVFPTGLQFASRELECGPPSLIGRHYRIKPGDTLLGVAGKAYGVGPGATRLRLAQLINSHSYNRRFWRRDLASTSFPEGRISFSPRFACRFRDQERVAGPAPRGHCYAAIMIPESGDRGAP